MNEFAKAFRKARLTSDKTFREISEHIGKSIGYLSDVENGRKNPPEPNLVKKIEMFLGVTDGSLSKLANELRFVLPNNLNTLVRNKPNLGQLLLRGDALSEHELELFIRELDKRIEENGGRKLDSEQD